MDDDAKYPAMRRMGLEGMLYLATKAIARERRAAKPVPRGRSKPVALVLINTETPDSTKRKAARRTQRKARRQRRIHKG